jgi:ABC-type branched-subunit amino acid transport system substrate-binding protein
VTARRYARGLPGSLLACAAILAGLAGCTAASSSQTVGGKTLYIYLSVPASAGTNTQQQDVLLAEQLAFNQLQGTVTAFKVGLVKVPSATPVGPRQLSQNARDAITNTSTIAYVGEVAPGSSADTLGITNAQDVLQISPTDTAAELTQTGTPIKDAPKKYYESLSTYGRTFARVVPTTAIEARDLVGQMQTTGVRALYVTGDGSEYGRTIAQEVTAEASKRSITVQSAASGSDAVFYAGSSEPGATSALSQAAASNPKIKLFVPSALDDPAFVAQLPPAVQRTLVVSVPGFLSAALNSKAKKFVSDFRQAYGHTPETQAVFGYAAMSALLNVLSQAGTAANNRGAVVHRFQAISNLPSVLGPLTMNAQGDTNITAFVFSRVKAGKLVPFKAA